MRTAIKEDLNPDLRPLHYAIRGILETNATYRPNIDTLKTAIEEEWNIIYFKGMQIILTAC